MKKTERDKDMNRKIEIYENEKKNETSRAVRIEKGRER